MCVNAIDDHLSLFAFSLQINLSLRLFAWTVCWLFIQIVWRSCVCLVWRTVCRFKRGELHDIAHGVLVLIVVWCIAYRTNLFNIDYISMCQMDKLVSVPLPIPTVPTSSASAAVVAASVAESDRKVKRQHHRDVAQQLLLKV